MKKFLYALFLVPVSIISMFVIIHVVTMSEPLFSIRNVRVNGLHQLREGDVVKSVSSLVTGSLFSIDGDKVCELLRSHPFVRDVRVKRVYPFSLVIDVTEKRPSALWVSGDGAVRVLDEHGEPFRKMMKDDTSLYVIQTRTAAQAKEVYAEVSEWVRHGTIGEKQISEVALDQTGYTLFGLGDGVEIILGNEDQKGRLKRALAVREDAKKRGLLIRCIDARFEKGAIIRERKDVNEG